MKDVHATTFRIVEALDHAGVAHALMGGVATQVHAIPTTTYDVDLTILATDVEKTLGALGYAGFDVPEEHRKGFQDSLAGMKKVRVVDARSSNRIEVDIFIVTTPFQEASFARRTKAELMGRTVTVFTPEDVILYKLIARRPKDLSAIQNILLTNPSLDRAYLADWAKKLGVEERLSQSVSEAEAFWRGPGP